MAYDQHANLAYATQFSNSNGVSFGLNAGVLTASHNGITSQSVQPQSTQPVIASASNGSFAFSTLGFSNANGVTFGTSAGSIVTASVGAGAAWFNRCRRKHFRAWPGRIQQLQRYFIQPDPKMEPPKCDTYIDVEV